MQWLVKSVSTSFSNDLSHEAKDSTRKAKTKDFKIVLEDEDLSLRTPTLLGTFWWLVQHLPQHNQATHLFIWFTEYYAT